MGLALGRSIHNLLQAFPVGIIGAMLLLVGLELARFAGKEEGLGLIIVFATALVSVVSNIAVGFATGIVIFYILSRFRPLDRTGREAQLGGEEKGSKNAEISE